MRATHYDRETAQNFGIPVGRVYAAAFALGAMFTAVVGFGWYPKVRRIT